MLNARPFWLLITCCVLTACNTVSTTNFLSKTEFKFVNENGDVAFWDVKNNTITYSNNIIELQACSAGDRLCLEDDWVRIVVPKACDRREFYDGPYGPHNGITVSGFEGLTGGINYFETTRKKFGYTYHPIRGITSIVLIPSNLPIQADSGFKIVPYVYYLKVDVGPFPCVGLESKT